MCSGVNTLAAKELERWAPLGFPGQVSRGMFGLNVGMQAGRKEDASVQAGAAIARWRLLHDDLLPRDSAACALRFGDYDRMGITWAVRGGSSTR